MTITIQTATAALEKAKEHHAKGELEEAKQQYDIGIKELLHLIKYSEIPSVKQSLEVVAKGYVDKYEALIKGHQPIPETTVTTPKELVLEEKPQVSWSDIVGLRKAKEALKESILLPKKFPTLFTGVLKPWSGILLYGPPGVGKTQLAKAVATETNSTFFSLSSADIVSKWLGDSEKVIKQLFTQAREKAPSVIFLDEVDSLCSTRGPMENDSIKRVKTELMQQTQGIKPTDNVLLLGATNVPWDIDPAMRRRFEKRIYIPLPDADCREGLIRLYLGEVKLGEEEYQELVALSEGFSGADISIAIREGLLLPIRRLTKFEHFREERGVYVPASEGEEGVIKKSFYDLEPEKVKIPLRTKEDFIQAFSTIKPSVSPSSLVIFEKWTEEFGETEI